MACLSAHIAVIQSVRQAERRGGEIELYPMHWSQTPLSHHTGSGMTAEINKNMGNELLRTKAVATGKNAPPHPHPPPKLNCSNIFHNLVFVWFSMHLFLSIKKRWLLETMSLH